MSRSWWLGVAAASTAIFALPASAQQPALTDAPGVPSVTVPPVTVPPATVPTVTVPPTAVTPPVSTSPVQTPSVTTPSVTTPSVPSGGTVESSAGSGTGAGSSGASGSGADGDGSGGGSGAVAGGANGSGSGSPAPSGAGDGPPAASHPRSADSGAASNRSRDDARRDRALRHAVLAGEGCLGRMPHSERRVLTLRAGVGRARPRTRAQVERITGLRRARIAALERSGLRRLRSLSATGCADTAGSGTDPSTAALAKQPPSTGAPPRITVRGQRQSSTGPTAAKHGDGRPRNEGLPLLHAPNSPLDLVPFAIAFGLAAGVFVFVREARRSD